MTSGSNPFEGMPFFGDLLKMLGTQGPVQWDGARQLALSIATGGESEPNVDPLERIRFEQLARVADLHVSQATGLSTSTTGRSVTISPVNRTQWALTTLDAFKPLIERMAVALHPPTPGATGHPAIPAVPTDDASGDPTEAWLGQIMGLLSPMLLGMTTGSLVGHLANRSFGLFDLPIPRPPSDDLLVVATNIEAFGTDWSMDGDDLRLWVCLHQLTHHAVLGLPHVRARLDELLGDYAGAFESDPDALGSKLGDLDVDPTGGDPMARFQELMGDPEVVLGAVRSARQEELLPWLETLVSTIVGYVDHIMDRIGGGLIGSYGQITEAMHRRRVESSSSDRFVERLLGLDLTQDHFDRGRAFVDGIVERAGAEGLEKLWSSAEVLPTPNELTAPGLWLARVGIEVELDLDTTFDFDDLSALDDGDEPTPDA
ncbi:zinc-dependent metalloprotease [Aquihabitans sp. G128]|uniref:zinc-dependent metalloprotease n=1 Tax=Aquihabitans sp. G128 TaxID=2849779 RepID=UPI001C23E683|nr:zinc-dependent metalloprotease [Aquihabitans sp. G128]QXC60453.1 zinc-dependent metalloprotease [Aquihabitans sp. G128]